jgi:hypothetical protein
MADRTTHWKLETSNQKPETDLFGPGFLLGAALVLFRTLLGHEESVHEGISTEGGTRDSGLISPDCPITRSPNRSAPQGSHGQQLAFATSLFALIPAGLFGFVCGVINRLYLLVRSAHIATTVRLISECGILGVLFSLCFSLFLRLLGWGPVEWTNLKGMLFIVSVGCPVSILYAIRYRRDLLRRSSSSPAPTN